MMHTEEKMQYRIDKKMVKALKVVASKEKSRPVLNRILLENGKVVATNGHILACLDVGNGAELPDHQAILVHRDTLSRVRAGETLAVDPETREGAIEQKNGTVLNLGQVAMNGEEAGTYPAWEQILPDEARPEIRFGISENNLKALIKVAAIHGDGLSFGFSSGGRAITLRTVGGERLGIVMPYRVENGYEEDVARPLALDEALKMACVVGQPVVVTRVGNVYDYRVESEAQAQPEDPEREYVATITV